MLWDYHLELERVKKKLKETEKKLEDAEKMVEVLEKVDGLDPTDPRRTVEVGADQLPSGYGFTPRSTLLSEEEEEEEEEEMRCSRCIQTAIHEVTHPEYNGKTYLLCDDCLIVFAEENERDKRNRKPQAGYCEKGEYTEIEPKEGE